MHVFIYYLLFFLSILFYVSRCRRYLAYTGLSSHQKGQREWQICSKDLYSLWGKLSGKYLCLHDLLDHSLYWLADLIWILARGTVSNVWWTIGTRVGVWIAFPQSKSGASHKVGKWDRNHDNQSKKSRRYHTVFLSQGRNCPNLKIRPISKWSGNLEQHDPIQKKWKRGKKFIK